MTMTTTTEGSPEAPAEVESSDVIVSSEDGDGQSLRRRRPYRKGGGPSSGPPTFVAVDNDGCGSHSTPDDDARGTVNDEITTSTCDACFERGGGGGTVIYATDPSPFPITGLALRDDFLTVEEEGRILRILDHDDDCGVCEEGEDDELGGEGPRGWRNTGFSSTDSRRRQVHVRRGAADGDRGDVVEAMAAPPPPRPSSFESRWGWLLDRLLMTTTTQSPSTPPSTDCAPPPLLSTTGCPCTHFEDDKERFRRWRHVDRVEIVAEEYRGASRPSPSVFEDRRPLSLDHRSSRPCHHRCRVALVVELSLGDHAVLSLQRPRIRRDDEWSLLARTKMLVTRRSAMVRGGEFLDDWRSHVSCRGQHPSIRGVDGGRGEAGEDGAVVVGGGGGGIELPDGMGRLVRDGSYRRVGLKIRFFQDVVDDDCSCDGSCSARGVEAGEVVQSGRSSPKAATRVDGGGNGRGDDDGGGKGFSCDDARSNVTSPSTSSSTSTSPFLSTTTSPSFSPPPPLHELLTVVVTTSPIKSNPSTELLERTFDTFHLAGRDFALSCRKVIVCDGLRLLPDEEDEKVDRRVSRKYANVKQSLRNGIATRDQAENYDGFKTALRDLCSKANAEADADAENAADDEGGGGGVGGGKKNPSPPSAFRNTVVVELSERHGYGFALREALRHHVTTPYVCVIQHDRTFMRPTPVEEVVRTMMTSGSAGGDGGGVVGGGGGGNGGASSSAHPKIRYVGMSMRSNLLYRDVFLTKYGVEAHRTMDTMVLRPRELRLSSAIYGKDGSGPRDMMNSVGSRKLRENLKSLSETYFASETYSCHRRWVGQQNAECDGDGCCGGNGPHEDDGLVQLTLTPTLFWYDNTHVAETAHYRDYVFDPRYRNVARGGFVEDKLSPVILRRVERSGLREGHSDFGCYLLDDHSGTFFTGHLDGGSYVTEVERGAIIAAMAASSGGGDTGESGKEG